MKLSHRTLFVLFLSLVFLALGELAAADPAASRSLTVSSGGVPLAATFYLPDGAQRPSGAVVLLHGSGPSTREQQRSVTEWFRSRGLAVLAFDKRGCGESGGSWIRASLDDLAADAAAVLTALSRQPELGEGIRIGFFGHSQAGWVVPRAIASGAAPDFAIVVAGGGARPVTVESFGYLKAFERGGLSQEQRTRAFGWIQRYFGYLETCQGREELARGLEGEQEQPWSRSAPLLSILPSEKGCSNWSWVARYDPLADLSALNHVPVLALFGGRDSSSPAEVSAARWRLGLALAGNDRSRVAVLPEAGHGLGLGAHGPLPAGHGFPTSKKAAPGAKTYLGEIEVWLRDQVLARVLEAAQD